MTFADSDSLAISERPSGSREARTADLTRVRVESGIAELYEARSRDVASEDSSTVSSCGKSETAGKSLDVEASRHD